MALHDRTRVIADRCGVLRDAWGWWASTLGALDDATWTADTRLEGWDVTALAAHHSMFVQGLALLASQPLDAPEPETPTARDMLRRFNEPDGIASEMAESIAEFARQQALAMSPSELVDAFAVGAPAAIATVERAGPVIVDYFGNGGFPLAEAVSIGILEAVVHGLDLCSADGVDAEPLPDAAVAHTVGLLASMADPIAFIDAATGRRAADVLPLLR